MVHRLPDSWSNWNLEMLVLEERGKPEYPEKTLSEQRRGGERRGEERRRGEDINPGRIGGRQALSPLCHPLLPKCLTLNTANVSECFFYRLSDCFDLPAV